MSKIVETITPALMRIRRDAYLMLPAELRHALNVREGDLVEGKIVEGGVLIKPAAVVQRQRALERIKEAASHVVDRQPDPNEDIRAEEQVIADAVRRVRHQQRHAES